VPKLASAHRKHETVQTSKCIFSEGMTGDNAQTFLPIGTSTSRGLAENAEKRKRLPWEGKRGKRNEKKNQVSSGGKKKENEYEGKRRRDRLTWRALHGTELHFLLTARAEKGTKGWEYTKRPA